MNRKILSLRSIILGTFFFLFLCWEVYEYWPVTISVEGSAVKDHLSIQMPLKDKKRLEYFFREACMYGVCAYTLMDSKPMSFDYVRDPLVSFLDTFRTRYLIDVVESFRPPHLLQKFCFLFSFRDLRKYLGWKTWQKYQAYFNHSRILTIDLSEKNEILFVNMPLIEKTVRENFELFQPVLEKISIRREELSEPGKCRLFIQEIMVMNHDGLLGTLLGFGRNNSWIAYNLSQGIKDNDLSSAWEEIEEENLEQLNKKTLSFDPWDLDDLFYPRFGADPSSQETHELKQLYRETKEKIILHYKKKDFLEATLSLFNKPPREL